MGRYKCKVMGYLGELLFQPDIIKESSQFVSSGVGLTLPKRLDANIVVAC